METISTNHCFSSLTLACLLLLHFLSKYYNNHKVHSVLQYSALFFSCVHICPFSLILFAFLGWIWPTFNRLQYLTKHNETDYRSSFVHLHFVPFPPRKLFACVFVVDLLFFFFASFIHVYFNDFTMCKVLNLTSTATQRVAMVVFRAPEPTPPPPFRGWRRGRHLTTGWVFFWFCSLYSDQWDVARRTRENWDFFLSFYILFTFF